MRPSAFAVLRLRTNSNLVGAWTGRSAGFSPLRMREVLSESRMRRSACPVVCPVKAGMFSRR